MIVIDLMEVYTDGTRVLGLMIVACASFYGLDVVYSSDNKTLLSKASLKAYHHINIKENVRTPQFLRYEDLLKKFRGLL